MESQGKFILQYLLKNKVISRNEALYKLTVDGHHITRLGAYIHILRDRGYKIKTRYKKGDADCYYILEE